MALGIEVTDWETVLKVKLLKNSLLYWKVSQNRTFALQKNLVMKSKECSCICNQFSALRIKKNLLLQCSGSSIYVTFEAEIYIILNIAKRITKHTEEF